MLTDPRAWAAELARRLEEALPGRVLFLGLQGSYRRGEATEESDIDIVAVLDAVDTAALDAYRAAVGSMPRGELACGFLCGRAELLRWPRFDLLQLVLDTEPIRGGWEGLLPAFSPADTVEAVRAGASALHHAAVHAYLYGGGLGARLAGLAKSVFFLLRLQVFRRTGRYCINRAELADCLEGPEEAQLFSLCRGDLVGSDQCEVKSLYGTLLAWASGLMA